MKLKHLLPIIFGVFSLFSCSKDIEITSEIKQPQEESYTIPIEDALSSLEEFLIEQGLVVTKGGMNDYIDNYFSISLPATKASCTAEDVLYAVNFKDESGYALLSADSRIQEEILAITDEGSVSEQDFEETSFERTPTENDDLSVSEYDEMVASGVLALQESQVNLEVKSYAIRQLETYNKDDVIQIGSPCDPTGPTGGGGGGSTPETYSWKTKGEKSRLLNTVWTQSTSNNDIFNKYCPEVGLIWKRKAPAGCVCIAVSQIIAYHEYPSLICNGLEIDYPKIKEIYSYDNMWNEGSETAKEMLARFCINVGGWCDIQYHSIFGKSFGFAWPWNAKSCLEIFGYTNVSWNLGYDEDQVIETLDDDCPVFISAIAGFLQGHAWVIDGYIKRNYVSNKGTVKDTQTLVHCNWGWHGNCNGYFTSGVFRTQDAVSYDKSSGNTMDEKYFCAFNTITYDSPQK